MSLNGVKIKGDYQKEGLMAYQARLKSPTKLEHNTLLISYYKVTKIYPLN